MSAQHTFVKIAGTALAAGALGVAAFATAATASAFTTSSSSADDTYLETLSDEGIEVGDPDAAIESAYAICEAISEGEAPSDIASDILSQTDLTKRQAAVIVVASVENYCPEYIEVLEA